MVLPVKSRWGRWCVFFYVSKLFLVQMTLLMLLRWLSATCIPPRF